MLQVFPLQWPALIPAAACAADGWSSPSQRGRRCRPGTGPSDLSTCLQNCPLSLPPRALPLQTEKSFKAETSLTGVRARSKATGWDGILHCCLGQWLSVLFIGTFQWGWRLLQAGAGSLPATSAVIRLYSSGFRKQKHVYYQATNQTDINLVKVKLKQSLGIIFWFRSHLFSWCKYFLQIMLREW